MGSFGGWLGGCCVVLWVIVVWHYGWVVVVWINSYIVTHV